VGGGESVAVLRDRGLPIKYAGRREFAVDVYSKRSGGELHSDRMPGSLELDEILDVVHPLR